MHDEAIVDRVRKLLALAGSPNVHEAAVAAARAQALIAAHRLEGWLAAGDPDVEDEPIEDARDAPLEVSRRLRKWKVALACALADVNGCVAYTAQHPDGEAIIVVGRATDREAVRALWDGLVRRVEWLSATHGAGRSKRWHEGFRIGAVQTIAERLLAAERPSVSDVPGSLVLLDRAIARHQDRLDRFVAERMRLEPGRSLRVDARAYDLGRARGHDLGLPDREG